ncbi:MAG: BlaI/MecI/CopY family transcriptional regulator, partial [Muribaculaceae bacterium]|nr:BlaI/MecI/CopY family transcriptional regulator [Muribaculaceae bacterium]
GRKKQMLTEKEAELMNMLWEKGPLFVRQMVDLYPDPKPHFNTVATTIRILETKGYVGHEVLGNSHRFFAIADKSEFRSKSIGDVIRNFFGNSYKLAISSLIEEEKISVDEVKEILKIIEQKNSKGNQSKSDNP